TLVAFPCLCIHDFVPRSSKFVSILGNSLLNDVCDAKIRTNTLVGDRGLWKFARCQAVNECSAHSSGHSCGSCDVYFLVVFNVLLDSLDFRVLLVLVHCCLHLLFIKDNPLSSHYKHCKPCEKVEALLLPPF